MYSEHTSLEHPISRSASPTLVDQGTTGLTFRVPSRPENRKGEHLDQAASALRDWRVKTWFTFYSTRPWGPQALLSDGLLMTIATNRWIKSIDDILIICPGWIWGELHGQGLVECLRVVDEQHDAKVAAEKESEERGKQIA